MAVIKHRAIDQPRSIFGKLLEILVVSRDHAPYLLLVETLQYRLGYGTADLRFRTAAKLIDKHKGAVFPTLQKQLHIAQM